MNQITHESIRELLKVYFIMGSANCEQDPQKILSDAILGGVTLFQLREKGPQALTDTKRLDFARKNLPRKRDFLPDKSIIMHAAARHTMPIRNVGSHQT